MSIVGPNLGFGDFLAPGVIFMLPVIFALLRGAVKASLQLAPLQRTAECS